MMATNRRQFAAALAAGGTALWSAPAAADLSSWKAVREQFVFPPDMVLMNAANLCPTSRPALETLYNHADLDHDLSPANRQRTLKGREATRQLLAAFLRVTPEEVLITRNTSEANNLVSSGLDLKSGDEVVALADNHPSNLEAWIEKSKRFGFTVKLVPQVNPHPGAAHYLEAFESQITAQTRLLALTHMTNTVGDVLPVAELCRLARLRGVLTLVDGAQSFGLMDVDLSQIQPDFYSGSGHKWLCGPKETGVLYVRRDVQERLWPSVISAYSGAVGLSRRHEGMGQRDDTAILALGEALQFQTHVGRPRIEARSRQLAVTLLDGLSKIPGVKLWTHPEAGRSHAVVTFQPGKHAPREFAARLYEKARVVCATRGGQDRPGIRLSPHFYNLDEDAARTLDAVRRLMA
jgi:selenocysteine lyase/cysteine desulfurase